MRAQQEALGHDCYILRSDNLAEKLLDVLMNVAQMPAVDQDIPRRLESVQREASAGEMGSRYDTDIFLRQEGLLDHARVESGAASNGEDRTSAVWGKSVSVRVDLGGPRIWKKKPYHNKDKP